ncbi:MAG: hypothetical protein Q4A92_07880 [Corynebacterium sp.]|nr:hypothetical protein [Corynebacterium sp.]
MKLFTRKGLTAVVAATAISLTSVTATPVAFADDTLSSTTDTKDSDKSGNSLKGIVDAIELVARLFGSITKLQGNWDKLFKNMGSSAPAGS